MLVIALQLWFMGWGAIEWPSNDAVMGGPSREPWLGRSLAAPTLADNGDNRSDRNGNGNDSGDDGTFRSPPIQPLSPLPPLQSSPRCTQTGSEAVFVSGDGKATLRAFPGDVAQLTSRRTTVLRSVGATTIPGLPAVGPPVYEIVAEPCGGGQPLAEFPAEVNFNLEYMDGDLYNVDERTVLFCMAGPADGDLGPG